MKVLLTFENLTKESAENLTIENEKIFITIENLGAVLTNVNENEYLQMKEFYNEWEDENYTINFQMKDITFVYEITNEKVSNVTTFLDLLLELDFQFTYETK